MNGIETKRKKRTKTDGSEIAIKLDALEWEQKKIEFR